MATTFESISLKGIRRADLQQLLAILEGHIETGVYWGNRDVFDTRNERLRKWLEGAVRYAYSENVKMPLDKPTKEPIEITGVRTHEPEKRALGYAVCRQWRDNPGSVDVYEYADTEAEAKAMIRNLRLDDRYRWFVGIYQ